MTQFKKLGTLTKGTLYMVLVFLYVTYLYGIVGFIKASKGTNDRKVDDYVYPLIWNFIFIAITLITIF